MGILALNEDRPTPKAVYNWRVYVSAAVASFASCVIGYDSAFIGTTLALPSFVNEFRLNEIPPAEKALISANIVSLYQAGAFFGSFFAYVSTYFVGRRKSLFVFTIIFILGAGLMLGANAERGLGLIYGGRVLAGVGVGACSMIVPIYISELSPPAIRGRLVGLYELGWQSGGLVGFWINYGVNLHVPPTHSQWLIPFAVQLIPGGLLFLGSLWIKESPRWLMANGKREQGISNLCWIRNLPESDIYITEEISFIDEDIERYRREVGAGFWKPFAALKTSRVQWRFFLGSALFFWQNGSGINAINYYSPTVFSSLGITGTNTGFLTTGLFGVVKTILTIVWLLWLIDHFGRRNLLMYGAAGGSICMWIIGTYIKIADPANHPTDNPPPAGIAAIFFFYLWTAFYTPSWNGTPWVLNSEMFDQNTRSVFKKRPSLPEPESPITNTDDRSLGQASAAASNWLYNFLISRFTPQLFTALGYGVYYFFASLMVLSIIFVFFLIPETKGVPLEAMDRLFRERPVWRAHGKVMEVLREQDDEWRQNLDGADLSQDTKLDATFEQRENALV
ncbi:general substrate transporter [Xylaria sp. FL1777]|nr:general substrate transporter [Xylaria sp. FL1777]